MASEQTRALPGCRPAAARWSSLPSRAARSLRPRPDLTRPPGAPGCGSGELAGRAPDQERAAGWGSGRSGYRSLPDRGRHPLSLAGCCCCGDTLLRGDRGPPETARALERHRERPGPTPCPAAAFHACCWGSPLPCPAAGRQAGGFLSLRTARSGRAPARGCAHGLRPSRWACLRVKLARFRGRRRDLFSSEAERDSTYGQTTFH